MKKIFKILKWISVVLLVILLIGIGYVRFSRMLDYSFGGNTDTSYKVLETKLEYKDLYFDLDSEIRIHGVLFKPDTTEIIATIYHHLGQGLTAEYTKQFYKPLLDNGFQVFAVERRGDGNSNGISNNLLTLKKDALSVFDSFIERKDVKNKPIIIWGQSLGGAFATMNASERNDKINGLIIEGTFNSLTRVGQHFVPQIKYLIPLILNDDFPAEKEIKKITQSIVIIHSEDDDQIPITLGEELYNASNKTNTSFWKIRGEHIEGILNYEKEYITKFKQLIKK
ncbi:MAG: alpha/beta hydrolase [Cellulophaga sp.]